MDESRIDDIPQVSDLENNFLTDLNTEEEVKTAIFQMEHNKAPGPDGFLAEFYQFFWEVIKPDLLELFSSLHAGQFELFRLNFGEIILLPKVNEEERIQQYRPICLLNVSFKIFTKVATIRLNSVAYDKVKWYFLHQTLRMKGFSDEWRALIHSFVSGGSVAIKVNDYTGHYFQTKNGLRQGDPLSPMLFNIVADMLAIMIERAKIDGQIEGVIPHLVDGGLSILQYADDTILFMEHDLEKAKNLKLILSAFEQLSGLKINFHKSELYYFGEQDHTQLYAELFGCNQGEFPIRYLGIPIHFRKLTNAEWKFVEERL
jgi:hypothetical protein